MQKDKHPLSNDTERNKMLAELAYQSTDMISRHTPNKWCFIDASPAVEALLGYTLDEIIGISAYDLYHPEDVKIFKKRSKNVIYKQGIYTHTYRFWSKKEQAYIWLESTSRTIRDERTGQIKEILVVSRDISHRMIMDATNQRLVRVMESTNDLVIFLTPNQKVKYLNEAACNTLQTVYANVHQPLLAIEDIMPTSDIQILVNHAFAYAFNNGSWLGELNLLSTQSQERIPVEMEVLCHLSSLQKEKSVEYYSIVAKDLRSSRQVEEELLQYKNSIEHVEKLIAMGEMASSLAHELNQPLAAIVNYAKGISRRIEKQDMDIEAVREPLEKITQTALRAGGIIHRIMNFTRKQNTSNLEPIALLAVVQELLNFCRSKAKQKNIALNLISAPENVWVLADKIQLEQILLNLLMNAIEAYQDFSENNNLSINIQIGYNKGALQVMIQDFGVGLPENQQDIFDRFYTTKPLGLGMGLTITRSLVESLGGELWASSDVENGTCFYFTLQPIDVK